ncbi:hypothetical protein [Pectobacterium brasiliense]|uniref:hypothetical protein n=1 Tax=Pectobacterium brasiliense TaxID=180957 RepID=UPI001968F6E9|nr:hypothetical protein [Pectobacterium brasiliense]MBN3263028.1 hypothetical protein [Pectobacterium brasiliense]
MQKPKYITRDALIDELRRQGHSTIYERTTEHQIIGGVGQIAPAKHLLSPNGKVVGIFVAPMEGWRQRESDDCVRDEPGIENNPLAVKHDVNAPKKPIRRL